MPKVTVVVPNYNHGRFLEARLDSIFAQTYGDFEVVFLDDASKDDSLRVFEPYRADSRIRTFCNTVNSGCVFKQWNKGVREARGEYIWFAESDDVANPRFLETLVAVLDNNPHVGLVYASSQVIDVRGKILGSGVDTLTCALHPTRWETDYLNDGRDECRRYLSQVNTIPNASAVVFRKELYERVGCANESMTLLGDWDMWVRILLVSDVAHMAEPLNQWRQALATSARSRGDKDSSFLQDYLHILRLILPLGLPPEVKNAVMETCVRTWNHQRMVAPGFADPHVQSRILQIARELDTDIMLAIVAAIASHAARIELANRRPFWNLVRGLLLPAGGRRHLLLKGFLQRVGVRVGSR